MSDNRAEDQAAIQAVLNASYKAWAAGDADAMVANYTEDATAIMTGSLRESRDTIRQNMARAIFRERSLMASVRPARSRPRMRSGCHRARGRWR